MKIGVYVILVLVFLGLSSAYCLEPREAWSSIIDSAEGRAIILAPSGLYVIAGSRGGSGEKDFLLISIDSEGNLVWERTYDSGGRDSALAVVAVSDGYVLAGVTNGSMVGDDLHDIYVVKTDAEGKQTWSMSYQGAGDEYARSIATNGDGSLVLAGYAIYMSARKSSIHVVKTSRNGELQWQKDYGDGQANGIITSGDGGFVLAGSKNQDLYVSKIQGDGTIAWEKTFGGPEPDIANSIARTMDGGYVLAGSTKSFGAGKEDVYVIKIDGNGDMVWEKTYGGADLDEAFSVAASVEGYLLAGHSGLFPKNAYLLKVNEAGELQWQMFYSPSSIPIAYGISPWDDGGFVATGSATLDMFIMAGSEGTMPVGEATAIVVLFSFLAPVFRARLRNESQGT